MLLGSPFGNHACSGKSRSHPQDIRTKLIALEAQKARRYPVSDLIPVKKTLAQVLGRVRMNGIFDPNTHIKTITIVGVGGTGRIDCPDCRAHPLRHAARTAARAAARADRPGSRRRKEHWAAGAVCALRHRAVQSRMRRPPLECGAWVWTSVGSLKPFDPERHADRFGSSLVISCVDNHQARRAIHRMKGILIAGGNHTDSGQVCSETPTIRR